MKKLLLLSFTLFATVLSFAQCTMTPNAGTYIMSPITVGNNYTLNGTGTYPAGKAFYICQGTIVTLQNRAGADTFYIATGAKLLGFEANLFYVFVKSGSTYDATTSSTASIYYETGSNIVNYTGFLLPPCPSLTFDLSQIGPNACTTTGIAKNTNWSGSIFVYPNPSQNEISINIYMNANKFGITVYDILGNKLMEGNSASNQSKLDISTLASGIYFVRVTADDKIVGTQKVMKQ